MRARLLLAVALTGLACARPAQARSKIVVSPGPDRIALTIYRAPYGRGSIDLRYLRGFAMVTEMRRIRLPRGTSVLRFESVAEGIVPVSAIVEGLPGGTIEKNRDARLLSPSALVDGTLGRQVTLTRTNRATGGRTSEDATIVAGPVPGVILRTASGIEALHCSGLPERLDVAEVPEGLSRKPVLSVTTATPKSRTVTVKLTYLASGFDWRASYVATLAADGKTLDLFAWLTLANANAETFPGAAVRAVAGRLNRQATAALPRQAGALRLVCYPLGTTTSDLREKRFEPADEIVVTASRAMVPLAISYSPPPAPPAPALPPEDLGDLKLYRVPLATTVSANAQKQVALLARTGVTFDRRYRKSVYPGQLLEGVPTAVVLTMMNEAQAGLGMPLPAGGTALYQHRGSAQLLIGLGTMTDRTIGERIRLAAGVSTQVRVTQRKIAAKEALLTVSNANPFPVTLDIPIGSAGQKIESQDAEVGRTGGIATWSPSLPPGGQAELRYRF